MAITTLLAFLQLYATVIIVGVGLLAIVVFLFTQNKLLFFSLIGAVALHVLLIVGVFIAGAMIKDAPPPEKRVVVTIEKPKEPEKEEPEKPKPKNLDKPLGQMKKFTKTKIMPKGVKITNDKPPPARIIVSDAAAEDAIITSNYDNLISENESDNINTSEIRTDFSTFTAGSPDGEGSGDVPYGFPDGKVGGRVYFISLKWGGSNSGWRANSEGLKSLLAFINPIVPCQTTSWPMTAAEIRMKYLMKNQVPSFIYIFCDETFALSSVDATVLRDYINKGGFLFMDSRDEAIKEKVSRELEKVTSGKLSPIANSSPIYQFLFKTGPVVGFNPFAKNYSISRAGRIVVFFTPGNFSGVYANYKPSDLEYIKGVYQMGANVMIYAIRKGDSSGITKQKGADTTVTKSVIDKLIGDKPAVASSGTGNNPAPEESVKIKPPSVNPGGSSGSNNDDPEEIKIE